MVWDINCYQRSVTSYEIFCGRQERKRRNTARHGTGTCTRWTNVPANWTLMMATRELKAYRCPTPLFFRVSLSQANYLSEVCWLSVYNVSKCDQKLCFYRHLWSSPLLKRLPSFPPSSSNLLFHSDYLAYFREGAPRNQPSSAISIYPQLKTGLCLLSSTPVLTNLHLLVRKPWNSERVSTVLKILMQSSTS